MFLEQQASGLVILVIACYIALAILHSYTMLIYVFSSISVAPCITVGAWLTAQVLWLCMEYSILVFMYYITFHCVLYGGVYRCDCHG